MATNSKHDDDSRQPAYADEVLCANWHPLVLLLAEPLVRAQHTALGPLEAEDLLARVYMCQEA
jgi:hypothetical protein